MTNRNSRAIESLVAYINDTKPYHSKLTEVVEEYLFTDSMNVAMVESTKTNILNKSTWKYNGYSSGNAQYRTHRIHRSQSPALTPLNKNLDPQNNGRFKRGRDELTELSTVDFLYPKKTSIAAGIADAWLQRSTNNVIEPLVESLDYHDIKGSFDFDIKQIFKVRPGQPEEFAPLWRDSKLETIISEATIGAQQHALDITNPNSAGRRLHSFITVLKQHLVNSAPSNLQEVKLQQYNGAITACDSIIAQLNIPSIPKPWTIQEGSFVLAGDYDALLNGAKNAGIAPPLGFTGWIGVDTSSTKFVDQKISSFLSNILFAFYTDNELNQDGKVKYPGSVSDQFVILTNITVSQTSEYDGYILEVTSNSPTQWKITSTSGNFIGVIESGESFENASISFDIQELVVPEIGHQIRIIPASKLCIHPNANLEKWSIIKTNPIAYTRPVFSSSRYAHLINLDGVKNYVTLLDPQLPTGIITLVALSATQLQLSSEIEPTYTGIVTVNTPFNDGRLAFTVINGVAGQLRAGDKFYLDIYNEPAKPQNLDLYYGYDLDSYDNLSLVYNNTDQSHQDYNKKIEFRFDSRFTDYDPSWLNLQLADNIVNGRSFRLVAVPNIARPISTNKRDGSGPNEQVDLADETSGILPDPALTGDPVYSMTQPALEADLLMYYADSFRLEYSDDGFLTKTEVAVIQVGDSFSSSQLGIGFTLAQASKPFIAVSSKEPSDAATATRTHGGDVFAFVAENKPPVLKEPATIKSAYVPRMVPHADGFFDSIDAAWTVTFTGQTTYTISATSTSGPQLGALIPGYPVTVNTAQQGLSFQDLKIQYSLFAGTDGFDIGDIFTFRTFKDNPSILVYGSSTGWTAPAKQGEWYWNGKIGFLIELPEIEVFETTTKNTATPILSNTWAINTGTVEVIKLRRDAPDNCYNFKQIGSRYCVYTAQAGLVGSIGNGEIFEDKYISITISDVIGNVSINIKADDKIKFWNAADSVLVKPDAFAKFPGPGDFTVIQKAEDTSIAITLDYTIAANAPNINDLIPVSRLQIGGSFTASDFDSTTGQLAETLGKTVPEENIFTNWISTTTERYISDGNKCNFSDDSKLTVIKSVSTGLPIATISSENSLNLDEPVYLTWDQQFFEQYVPLNTQFNIVNYGTGLNDVMKVRMLDKATFLISGGPILQDALFNEDLNLSLVENTFTKVNLGYTNEVIATVQDGPFTEFLSGYDNHPFDAELTPDALNYDVTIASDGQFDTGLPLTDYFTQAKELAALSSPTPAQRQLLDQLTASFAGLLNPGGLESTSLANFIQNFNADAFKDAPDAPTLGIPKLGLGVDILQRDSDSIASASFTEALVFTTSLPTAGFGDGGFGASGFSQFGLDEARMTVSGPLPIGTINSASYAEAETPLEVVGKQVTTVQLTFSDAPQNMVTPRFYVWISTEPAPFQVPVVQAISNGVFKFSISQPSQIKVFVL